MLLLKKYIIPRYHFKFHMTQFNPSTNIVNQQLRSYIEVRTHAWTWERNFRVMQIFFPFHLLLMMLLLLWHNRCT